MVRRERGVLKVWRLTKSFRFLRSLSRVAGDYFSESVVCVGNSVSFAVFAWERNDPVSSVICHQYSTKNFTSLCAWGRAEYPRVGKARSSYGISREHEWARAWQYVSISRAMWERKRELKPKGTGGDIVKVTPWLSIQYTLALFAFVFSKHCGYP